MAQRFGWTDADRSRAEQWARDHADPQVWHVVEVYDEGEFTVQSQPHDPVGVIYAVLDGELGVFTEQHHPDLTGPPQVLDTYGPSEDEDVHPEHVDCADGCGLAVTHDGPCLDKPGGRVVCSPDNHTTTEEP